jgi:crooked neck
MRKRAEFEAMLRNHKHAMGLWLRYAAWEESQYELKRARNVYERALDVDYKDSRLWLKYASMEMKAQFIQRARNVLNRAVTLLPRVDAFWYRFVYMEQMVGNIEATRAVFLRWMEWEPEPQSWQSFINFEVRNGGIDAARSIWERFILCHPIVDTYVQFARWEQKQRQPALARLIFDRALEELTPEEQDEELFVQYSQLEEGLNEFERARAILKLGVGSLPATQQAVLLLRQASFEKKHGERSQVEELVYRKRKEEYEADILADPLNYDSWFDYIRLEQGVFASAKTADQLHCVRQLHQRAQAARPPVCEKVFWKRYIYLWLFAAVFEEQQAVDFVAARTVYSAALAQVPHEQFTFSKLWLMAARFEIRRLDIAAARRILGSSLGRCPRRKVIAEYVDLELRLGNVDRCRTLLSKQAEVFPSSALSWCQFSEFEQSMGELQRARGVLEIAVQQPDLDPVEVVWKSYIDLEIECMNWAGARSLFERLLDRSKGLAVWNSFAAFEATHTGEADSARTVYGRGYKWLKSVGAKSDCARLLASWLEFEQSLGDFNKHIKVVQAMQPTRVVKRRAIADADGTTAGMEEYHDFVFPDDDESKGLVNLVALTKKWAAGDLLLDAELDNSSDDEVGEQLQLAKTQQELDLSDSDIFKAPAPLGGAKRPAESEAEVEVGADDNEIAIDDL